MMHVMHRISKLSYFQSKLHYYFSVVSL